MASEFAALLPVAKRIDVLGRTDGMRPTPADERVAMMRATSARDYLVSRGADPQTLFVQYASATDYLGDNDTAKGRALNRRVEIIIGL